MMVNYRKVMVFAAVLFFLIGGSLVMPSSVGAASWLPKFDSYAADWVKDIDQALRDSHQTVFMNDPRSPQFSIVEMLNRAAVEMKNNNAALAKDYVDRAIAILEEGVRSSYYSEEDIKPLVSMIKERTHAQI